MGRPPIGKRPMTAAERQQRHRLGLTSSFRDTAPVTKQAVTKPNVPVTKQPDAHVTKLAAKALQERLDEIEFERDQARAEVRRLRKIGIGAGTDWLRNEAFQKQLKEIIEGLVTEGRKNMVTMVPAVVLERTIKLERLLADHGIWLGSKRRKTNPGWDDHEEE
jgi:hypothetical protein